MFKHPIRNFINRIIGPQQTMPAHMADCNTCGHPRNSYGHYIECLNMPVKMPVERMTNDDNTINTAMEFL